MQLDQHTPATVDTIDLQLTSADINHVCHLKHRTRHNGSILPQQVQHACHTSNMFEMLHRYLQTMADITTMPSKLQYDCSTAAATAANISKG